jgi:hypothetical protein
MPKVLEYQRCAYGPLMRKVTVLRTVNSLWTLQNWGIAVRVGYCRRFLRRNVGRKCTNVALSYVSATQWGGGSAAIVRNTLRTKVLPRALF